MVEPRAMKRALFLLSFAVGCSRVAPQAIPNHVAEVSAIEHTIAGPHGRLAALEKWTDNRATRPAILLVHGATFSSRPDFDLRIRDYSLMEFFAQHGFDVWALDIHGYGHSEKPSTDGSDTESATQDVEATVETMRKERGIRQIDLFGWSWGTQVAGLYASRHPDAVRRLVLYAPFWKGRPEWPERPLPTEPTKNNVPPDMSDFIAGEGETDVMEAYARSIVETDPRSPNGVRGDLYRKLPLLDPAAIRVPTLIIRGEKDPISLESDLLPFFAALGTHDKSYVELPHGGHAVMLEKRHHTFQHAVLSFLQRP
jgi:pimeloyl-ACP methyl ester carboxylesterase